MYSRWFEEAAKLGDSVAHYLLAVFHTHEIGGLRRDIEKEIRSVNLSLIVYSAIYLK